MYASRLAALVSLSLLLSSVNSLPAAAAESRLNVLLILADDLGYSDTTLYGTTTFYKTANIERLAARGMTFTRAYSASPLCSPTRASILTGLSPARHGITAPVCHLPAVVLKAAQGKAGPPSQPAVPTVSVTRLSTEYATLPKSLKRAGYATAHFGKWHLGHEPYSPLEHGFDLDLPHHPGPGPAGSYVAPWKFRDFDPDPDQPRQHIEDRMAREAVRWMEAHRDEPFFLNYWMFSVHAPFDAKAELIAKYRGLADPQAAQRSPTYAAMIESMDDAVGTLLDALDRLALSDRTLVIFASDNGGNMYNQVDGTTPTSNAPLRGGKATMFEGGIRGPCIVVWPGIVKPGSRSEALIQSCDFYPTLLEILGIPPATGQAFDGVSLVPALRQQPLNRKAIFTYFPHNPRVPDWLPPAVSVHRGNWKLIRIFHGDAGGSHAWRLYDLAQDPGEQRNLAAAHPERVAELDALIDQFLKKTGAIVPQRNPAFDPAAYHPERIGQPQPKPAGGRRAGRAPAVAGWVPSKDCRLRLNGGQLVLTSTGKDPFAVYQFPKPLAGGRFRLQVSLSSTGRGRGQLFWHERGATPRFQRDHSVGFSITHDGKQREYEISFGARETLEALRLDPGQAEGTVTIHSAELRDDDGNVLVKWRFTPPPKGERSN